MRFPDSERRLHDALLAQGIELTRQADGWSGPGSAAHAAWRAFATLAAEAVDEPVQDRDRLLAPDPAEDDGDLLLFEAIAVELSFTRQVTARRGGEYAGMQALTLTVWGPAGDPEHLPDGTLWGMGGPLRGDVPSPHPEIDAWAGGLARWIHAVETLPAFTEFFSSGDPEGFSFGHGPI